MQIILNDNQQQALSALRAFAHSGQTSYALMGAAGTGKTTVLKNFVTSCGYDKDQICLSAPTHKARKVMERVIGMNGKTIHSLLGLKPEIDLDKFDYNNPKFDGRSEPKLPDYSNGILIVDESSMINRGLVRMLIEECKKLRIKILFVGDPFQLPPVKESVSTAFVDVDGSVELTEVVRQAQGNPISKLLVMLREDISEGSNSLDRFIDHITKYKEEINEEGGYLVENGSSFTSEMLKDFKSEDFIYNTDYCRYLAFTNNSITTVNQTIKDKIYGDNFINEGQLMMGYSTIYKKTLNGSNPVLINSEDYIIGEFEEEEIVSHLNDEGEPVYIKVYKTFIKPVFRNKWDPEGYWVDIIHPSYIPTFVNRFNSLLNLALTTQYGTRDFGKNWKNFYSYKDSKVLLGTVPNNFGESFKGKPSTISKDVDYAYGLTVHKSQGSTYDNVYVNVKNILVQRNVEFRNRLLYVACSRAKKNLHLFF